MRSLSTCVCVMQHTHRIVRGKGAHSSVYACVICFYCMDDVSKIGAHVAVSVDKGGLDKKVRVSVCVSVIALPLWVCIMRDSRHGRHSQHSAQSDSTNPAHK